MAEPTRPTEGRSTHLAELAPSPGQTIGPFFHDALPYARGHELVSPGSAGAVRLHGTVLDGAGQPVPDALIELRQADASGRIPTLEGSLRRDGMSFTGWGRASTDPAGRYAFVTVVPAPTRPGGAAFFAVVVFARGLLNRLFTRAYLPGQAAIAADPLLSGLTDAERSGLVAVRDEDGSLRFDIHLQGEEQTTFLAFPRHEARP